MMSTSVTLQCSVTEKMKTCSQSTTASGNTVSDVRPTQLSWFTFLSPAFITVSTVTLIGQSRQERSWQL